MKYTEKDITTGKDITFVNVKLPNIIVHDVIGRQDRLTIDGDNVSNIDNEKTLINAIDIDWNGAQLGNDLINTTADLLNYIKNKTSGSGDGSSLSSTFSYTTSCYRWYREGHIPQSITAKPFGNLIDIFNPDANLSDRIYCIPEKYWSKNAPNRPQGDYILWLSLAEVRLINGVWTIESWSNPFLISGINGTPGEDLSNREFIYKLFTTKHDWSTDNSNLNPEVWPATDDSDYVGPLIDGVRAWKDNPEGVDDANRYEYESQRTFENGHWTKFCRPYLRSCFGRNGMDGDGVEYVYIRTEGNTQPTVSQNQGNSTLLEQLNDEYLPYVDYVDGNSLTHHERCTDDPTGINSTYKYEWVLKRRKTSPDPVTGERLWLAYSGQMALWAKYSEGGDSVEVRNGLLYINGVPQNITVEGQSGGGILLYTITDLNVTPPEGTVLGKYNGLLYVWIDGNPGHWVSLGESNGSGAYGHIAYADSVTISQVDNKTVIAISGFTVDSGSTSKKWIGIYIDDNESDPGSTLTKPYTNPPSPTDWSTAQTELSKYKWQYVAGKDGNGFEFIYCLTKSGVIPGIDESDGITEGTNGYISGNKLNSEFYPKITVQNGVVSLQVSTSLPTLNDKYYWSDDPVGDVDSTYTTLWWANRKFVNGEWTNFRGPSKIDEWTEGITTSPVPFYKWNTGGAPSAPSNPTSGLNYVTVAENAGWSLSIAITNPDPTNALCKLYCCTAILENSVFKEWSSVIEVDSPNIIQPADGVSPYQLTCYPSAISVRANPLTGDFIDKEYNIGCSLILGSENKTGNHTGYYVYYKKLYTEVNESWLNLSTVNNGYYNVTFKTDFKTSSSYNSATGISQEYSNNGTTYGYLIGIEFCLSSTSNSLNISASNTLASITVPITCDGQKGASSSSAGLNGTSTYIIKLYRKLSSSEISALTSGNNDLNDSCPNLTIYYDFTDNKIYSGSTNGNIVTQVSSYDSNSKYWYLNKDDAANFEGDLYVTVASAITTDTSTRVQILSSLWATPVLYTDSLNTATIFLYKRSSTTLNSNNKPSGFFTYNFLSKEFNWVETSQQWNLWSKTIPSGTDPCYIIQATACSATNIDYINGSEFSDPVLYVKNGDPGQSITGPKGDTGKMFFSMGVWDENETYVLDTLKIPMVFYDDGEWNEALGCNGSYYYLNPEYTDPLGILGVNTNPTGSASKFDNNTKNIWIKATNYGLVMTQGIFAEFAKFGSAIISGDYMFSTKGTYSNKTTIYDSALYKLPTTGTPQYPLYTFFVGDPDQFPEHSLSYNDAPPASGSTYTLVSNINSANGRILHFTFNLYIDLGSVILAIKDINSNELLTEIKSISSSGTKDFDYVLTKEGTFNLILLSRPVSGIRPTYISLNGTVKQSGFIPNWWVDLKTGVMSAGRGNFKVDSNGNVSVKGNIESGSDITGATISGAAISGGIIKADNFYRNVWVSGEPKYKLVFCALKPTKLEEMLFEFLDLTYYNNHSTYTPTFEQEKYYNIYYPSDPNFNTRMYDSSLLFWYRYSNWNVIYIPPKGSRYPFGTYDRRLDETDSLYNPNLIYDPESDPNFDFNNSEWRYFINSLGGNGWSLNGNVYSKTKNYGSEDVTYEILAYEAHDSDEDWKPYFLECTGNSDLIIVSDNAPNNTLSVSIVLPRPQDFPNKVIEILDLRYVNSGYLGNLELKSMGSGADGTRNAHFSLSFTGGNNKQSLILNGNNDTVGRNYSFISYEVSDGLNGTRYCWVKMNSDY